MEGSKGKHKASSEDLDVISRMPDNVVTNIFDRLPLQYAVRTSTLSRKWRFKWTMLSQLVFDENFFRYLSRTYCQVSLGTILSMFLLHHKGNITKFVLYMDADSVGTVIIFQWIEFLCRRGIKDFTIDKRILTQLKLPTSLFSCLELKHLKLGSCSFNPPPSFRGFPYLLSLELCSVYFESGKFGELFTQCSELEILKLGCQFKNYGVGCLPQGKVKLVEIAKLVNINILSLSLCSLDTRTIKSIIIEPMGFLPKLQKLILDLHICKYTEDGAKNCLPTIPHLKTLKISTINLDYGGLSCAFETIRSFPNLQTLEIDSYNPGAILTIANRDFDITGMLELRSVVFTYSNGSENEVCLIKFLLACSPFLEKIVIRPSSFFSQNYYYNDGDKFMFSKKLLKLRRASPDVEIDLS